MKENADDDSDTYRLPISPYSITQIFVVDISQLLLLSASKTFDWIQCYA